MPTSASPSRQRRLERASSTDGLGKELVDVYQAWRWTSVCRRVGIALGRRLCASPDRTASAAAASSRTPCDPSAPPPWLLVSSEGPASVLCLDVRANPPGPWRWRASSTRTAAPWRTEASGRTSLAACIRQVPPAAPASPNLHTGPGAAARIRNKPASIASGTASFVPCVPSRRARPHHVARIAARGASGCRRRRDEVRKRVSSPGLVSGLRFRVPAHLQCVRFSIDSFQGAFVARVVWIGRPRSTSQAGCEAAHGVCRTWSRRLAMATVRCGSWLVLTRGG
mmetsp:Transcript_7228/g.45106  ORF Transcript_7228/g.45106 Transcript_7228/m.45106 type:complete len:282 (-) Transcript_7228:77-922(-)